MPRGQISESITPIITILILITLSMVFYFIYDNIQSIFAAESSVAGEIIDDGKNMAAGFDNAAIFILIALWASTIITGVFVETHPVFFVISLIFFIFGIVIAGSIANIWELIAGADTFATISTTYFTKTNLIMTNAPLFVGVGIFLWAVGFYAKRRFI